MRPRERNRFLAVYRLSRIPSGYYNPGNLLSLNEQVRRTERIGFGHSFGTEEKQGRGPVVGLPNAWNRRPSRSQHLLSSRNRTENWAREVLILIPCVVASGGALESIRDTD